MNEPDLVDPLLKTVMEKSSDFFGIADSNGMAIFVNKAGRKVFGIDAGEDVSKISMHDFIADKSKEEFQKELVEKALKLDKVKHSVFVKNFKTSEEFQMSFELFCIDDQKYGSRFMAFGKDLRSRISNQDKLRVFEAVIENSSDFVGIADNDLNPTYLNPAGREMLGIPLDQDIREVQIADCYPDDVKDFAQNTILKEMMETGHWSGETYFRHFETNEKIPVHDTHFVISSVKDRKPLGHATITRSMKKEKSMQKELDIERQKMIQASKLATLGEMAAGIAHEINNPLAVIDGATSILKRKVDDPAIIRKVDMITKSSERIGRIVKSLRKFSRDSHEMNKSVFLAKDIVGDCLELLKNKCLKYQVEIICGMQSDCEFYADEVQIEQVLVNLISNAIDANKDNKDAWIKLSCNQDENYVRLYVQDSGEGIPEMSQDSLFDPFVTTKAPGEGTGLGLSISKGIAQDHGGDLEYALIDGHTTFILSIPVRRK